ncbi:MAG: TonB-dependent receptor [Candidatus Cloacimonadota bacterium]|nr:TonB-dependent receptor [Candidatus Cloacimonadota bacterium]
MKKLILILLIFIFHSLQSYKIKVTDENKQPLAGVIIKNGEKLYITDQAGTAEIEVKNDSIYFSRIGFEKLKIHKKEISSLIQMHRNSLEMEGVTVRSVLPQLSEISDLAYGKKIRVEKKNVEDILQKEPEIRLLSGGAAGETKTVSLGGLDPKYSLIMLDGIPLNSSGKEFDISTLPLEMVTEVEVISGNSGAIGGSGAVGGIVNFITTQKEDFSYNSAFGSFGYYKNNISFQHNFKKFHIGFNAAYTKAKNDFTYDNQLSEQEDQKRENNAKQILDLGMNISWLGWQNVELKTFYQDFYKQLPGNIGSLEQFDSCFLEGESLRNFLKISGDKENLAWETRFFHFKEFSLYDNSQSSGNLNIIGKTFYKKYGNKSSLQWKKQELKIEPGLEIISQDFRYKELTAPINSVTKTSMINYAAFLQLQNKWLLYPIDFTGKIDLRHDSSHRSDSLDFEAFSSYLFSGELEYENVFRYEAGFSWGNSYLLPSFYDLYWKGGMATSGNPNLKPEKSRGYKLWAKISSQNSYVKFSYNYKKIDDSIYWYKSLLSWKPGNIGGAEVTSYNVEGNIKLPANFAIYCSWLRNFAYDNSDIPAYENKFLTYVPTSVSKMGLSYQNSGYEAELNYERTGKRWPSRDHLWGYLPAYETINANASYNFALGNFDLTTEAKLNNILNNKYQKYLLTPEPGFNWSLNLKIKLKK